MQQEDDIKRINFNIPRELYDRFIEASQKEYMTTSSVITGWITNYVREKEKERQDVEKKALQSTMRTLSKLTHFCTSESRDQDASRQGLKEISELLLDLSTNPELSLSIDFQAKIAKLERVLGA